MRESGPQAASEKLHAYFRKARAHRDAIDALIGAAEDRTEEARTGLPWLARATVSVSTVMLGVVAFPETAGLRALASVGCGATTALETWSRRSGVARPGEPVLVEALVAGAADAFATASMGVAGHAAAGSGARVGYLALGFFARANQGFLPSVLRGEALSVALGEAGAAMLADAPNVVGPLQDLNGRIAQRLARESLITRIPTRLTRLIPPAQEQVQAAIETACDLTRDTLMAGLEEVTGANVEDAVSGVGSDIAAGGRAGPSGAHPGASSAADAGDYRFIERLLANASTTEAEMRSFWLLGRAPESRMSMRGPTARR
ncbi:MAG: hypothetical protein IPL88_09155 [Rhizobiales bacterium]|nr:hypothetical protein [Hyphomicrobiales bacterium]